MRKLLIAGLAVASLTSIAYGQVERSDSLNRQLLLRDIATAKTTCVDGSGATRNLYETTMRDTVEYKCVPTFGDGLKVQGAGWIISSPNVRVVVF